MREIFEGIDQDSKEKKGKEAAGRQTSVPR